MTKPDITDEQLDQLLARARESWRAGDEPDHDTLWERIERDHFDRALQSPPSPWRTPNWRVLTAAVAAALVIGAGIGRFTAPDAGGTTPVVAQSDSSLLPRALQDPMRLTTTEYLGETAALLASLPLHNGGDAVDARFAVDAATLLSTTRLLLDSPTASDPALRALLDDLELVLAQIARLPARRDGEELQFITEAIEARDVVPRLRLAAADYHAEDF